MLYMNRTEKPLWFPSKEKGNSKNASSCSFYPCGNMDVQIIFCRCWPTPF